MADEPTPPKTPDKPSGQTTPPPTDSSGGSSSGGGSARITNDAPGRIILGLMVFTMVFALVGTEIDGGKKSGTSPTLSPGKIIFGGTVATSLLTLMSHAGEAGEKFATGLATIAFTTSALVYGKPVWDKLNGAFGSEPTGSTSTSSPTAPSGESATTMATEQTIPLAATTALAVA